MLAHILSCVCWTKRTQKALIHTHSPPSHLNAEVKRHHDHCHHNVCQRQRYYEIIREYTVCRRGGGRKGGVESKRRNMSQGKSPMYWYFVYIMVGLLWYVRDVCDCVCDCGVSSVLCGASIWWAAAESSQMRSMFAALGRVRVNRQMLR